MFHLISISEVVIQVLPCLSCNTMLRYCVDVYYIGKQFSLSLFVIDLTDLLFISMQLFRVH
jgi:hypothetical protein